jgi:predicted GNAT family N-acyltransferase
MHLERADITFIRPLITCREKDIISLIKEENLPVSPSNCPADKLTTREEIKNILFNLYKEFPEAKNNFLNMLSHYEKFDLWDKDISYQINQENLILKPILTPYEMSLSLNIRYEVFVKEMGIDYEDEFVDELEKSSTAFLIYKDNNPIGTIRYRETSFGLKMERFAIKKEYRNLGYGREVIKFLIEYLTSRFYPKKIYLHAMAHLKEFYKSCDLTPDGDIFLEANIPHIKFIKE